MIKLVRHSAVNGFYKITLNCIEIGTIHFSVKDNGIILHNLEIYEEYESKGYGKNIIAYIKSCGFNKIIGESTKNAEGFWLKIGAKLHDGHFEINLDNIT